MICHNAYCPTRIEHKYDHRQRALSRTGTVEYGQLSSGGVADVQNLSPQALAISGRQSELIELALSFGFRGLDLDFAEFADQVKSHGLPHAKRLLDSAKLQIGGFPLPTRWQGSDATFREDMTQLAAWAPGAAEGGFRRALNVDRAS